MTGVCLCHLGRDGAASSAPSPAMRRTAEHMLRVIRNHRRAAYGETDGLRGPRARRRCRSTTPPARDPTLARPSRSARLGPARSTLGEKHGYRNAQATVIAPTGTIGLVMDCDTTGIEPDFALVKFKKLAGGGYFKIINRAVPEALRALGYRRAADRRDRSPMRSATARSARRPASTTTSLAAKGFDRREDRDGREGAAVRLRHQVRLQQMDARRGLLHATRSASRPSSSTQPDFDLLAALGFTKARDRRRQRSMSAAP